MSRQKPKTDLCLCMEYDSISEVGGKLAVTFFNLLPTTCEEIEAKKGHGAYSTAYSQVKEKQELESIYSDLNNHGYVNIKCASL